MCCQPVHIDHHTDFVHLSRLGVSGALGPLHVHLFAAALAFYSCCSTHGGLSREGLSVGGLGGRESGTQLHLSTLRITHCIFDTGPKGANLRALTLFVSSICTAAHAVPASCTPQEPSALEQNCAYLARTARPPTATETASNNRVPSGRAVPAG